ncbi:MAG: hypothetical protein ABF297_14275 [Thiogranum sp.]
MGRLFTLLVTLGILLSVSCAQQPTRPAAGEDSSLQRWLDTELAPYLVQQLGQHPRFKGESFILVRLDGPDIQADIDGLTRSMRDRLMDSLLTDAGVRLPWQPQQQPAQHHRRLDQAECGRIRDANYYIGIEITRSATAQYRVSVRALDVRAGEWVSGFGKSWSGALAAGELRALQERRSDESLRGLRVLPFSSGHPDLAASYLANNLSCLLRQREEDDLVIYVESLKSDRPRLRTLLGLIGNNLSRYREVRVTDARGESNFLLRGEAHEVQSGLYQLWVVLRPKNSGEHLSGMDTATYVRLLPAGGGAAPGRRANKVRGGKPAIAGMELVRRHNSTGDSHSCPQRQRGASGGAQVVDGCPVLELSVERSDQVFVFVHGSKDGISRLSSGSCADAGEPTARTAAIRSYLFPARRFSNSDWPTIYAIAVSGSDLARQFTGLLQVLPDACGDAAGMRADSSGMDQWLSKLDRLVATNSDHAVWTARRIP